jgi:enamidase
VQPLGILRMIALLSSDRRHAGRNAFCFATGNTARMRNSTAG